MRNIIGVAQAKYRDEQAQRLVDMFNAPTLEESRAKEREIIRDYEATCPKSVRCLENGFDDAAAVYSLPGKHWKKMRTSNMIERLSEEIRRRERVIRLFPNETSAVRLLGAVLQEINEKRSSGKYMEMEI